MSRAPTVTTLWTFIASAGVISAPGGITWGAGGWHRGCSGVVTRVHNVGLEAGVTLQCTL